MDKDSLDYVLGTTSEPCKAEAVPAPDLNPNAGAPVALPARPKTVFNTKAEAEAEVMRLLSLPGAPKTYQEACARCLHKEIEFMNEVMAGVESSKAAGIAFGLRGRSAVNKGNILTTRTPRIMLAMELARRSLAAKIDYSFDQLIRDLDKAQDFAKKNGNPAAFTRAIELKAKLTGLLSKDDSRPEGTFKLVINGV